MTVHPRRTPWLALAVLAGCSIDHESPTAPAGADLPVVHAGPPPGGGSPPSFAIAAPVSGATFGVGAPVAFHVDFVDPDLTDIHSCSFEWQPGSLSPGAVVENGGSGTCQISLSFPAAGSYPVVVTVADNMGLSASDTIDVSIATAPPPPPPPPSGAGSVVGEGRLGGSERNRVRFVVLARGPREGRPLRGAATIQFGGRRLESTTLTSFGVTGRRADMHGEGRIGRQRVSFAVSLVDGDRRAGGDKARIRVWDTTRLLLDTDPSQPTGADPVETPRPGRVVIRP